MPKIIRHAIPRGSKAPKSDAALVQAEKDLAAAWRRALAAPQPKGEIPRDLADVAFKIDAGIAKTKCLTLVGAAVKLRRVLDPETGMQAGDNERDLPSLRHVLAVVERMAGKAGAV